MKKYELSIKKNEGITMLLDRHPLTIFNFQQPKITFEVTEYIENIHITLLLNGILYQWWCDSFKLTDVDGNEI